MKGMAGGDAAAPGPRAGQWVGEFAQCQKGRTRGIVNIVGEHATHHIQYDAPADRRHRRHCLADVALGEDVDGRQGGGPKTGAEAIHVASSAPGQIASLILPGDTAWNEGGGPEAVPALAPRGRASEEAVRQGRTATGKRRGLHAHADRRRREGTRPGAGRGDCQKDRGAHFWRRAPTPVCNAALGRVPVDRVPFSRAASGGHAQRRAAYDPGRGAAAGGVFSATRIARAC